MHSTATAQYARRCASETGARSSRMSSAVSDSVALRRRVWRVRRRRFFLRRGSAGDRGRAVRVFWMRESGTELRRRNSMTHREMSLFILLRFQSWEIALID